METNFNLGSLKIVYSPLMEYFKKVKNNVSENLSLVRDSKKVATNYEFIDVLNKIQSSLKMIGLVGVVKTLSLIQEAGKELKEIKFDTNKSIQIWEASQQLLKDIENYIEQLLDASVDEPTKLFAQYQTLAILINKEVSIKDLFSPKLDVTDINFQNELRVGQFINDNNKSILIENLKKSHTIIQQSLVTLFVGISNKGIFDSIEDKNTHHSACKKIFELLTQLQEQKISKSYYVLFGIQKLLVCTATPFFNDSFLGLVGEYAKDLKFNLAKIEKTIKNLIDEVEELETGDKTGNLKANDDIVKENLYFVIEMISKNDSLKTMPVFKELSNYFNYNFYDEQLKVTKLNISVSQSNPEVAIQIDKILLEIKEEFVLLTGKQNTEEFFNKHINKFYLLNYKFNEVLKTEYPTLKVFSTIFLSIVEKLKNKELVFENPILKEISVSIVLLEYAINLLVKKSFSQDEIKEFENQLTIESNRLNALGEGKDISGLPVAKLDSKNKENDEQKAILKIFTEVSKEIKVAEEILDNILRTREEDLEELAKVFKPLNTIKGIFNILNKKDLAKVSTEISNTWYQIYNNGLLEADNELIENSVIWLSGLSLYISASELNDTVEADLIEERLLQKFNTYFGKDINSYSLTKEIDFENLSDITLSNVNVDTELLSIEEEKIKELDDTTNLLSIEELAILPILNNIEAPSIEKDDDIEKIEINEILKSNNIKNVENSESTKNTENSLELEESGNIHEVRANDNDLLLVFLEEFKNVQKDISKAIEILKSDLTDRSAIGILRRGYHTIKGSGRMVGLHNIGEIAWKAEQELNKVVDSDSNISKNLLNVCEHLFITIGQWVNELELNNVVNVNVYEELAKIDSLLYHVENTLHIPELEISKPEEITEIEHSSEHLIKEDNTTFVAEPILVDLTSAKLIEDLNEENQTNVPLKNLENLEKDPIIVIDGMDIDLTIYNLFETESKTHLDYLDSFIISAKSENNKMTYDFMRHAHTLSSIAQAVNLKNFKNIAAKLEFVSNIAIEKNKLLSLEDIEVLEKSIQGLYQYKNTDILNLDNNNYEEIIILLDILQSKLSNEDEIVEINEDKRKENIESNIEVEPSAPIIPIIELEHIINIPKKEEATLLNDEADILDVNEVIQNNSNVEVQQNLEIDNEFTQNLEEKESEQMNKDNQRIIDLAEQLSSEFKSNISKTVDELVETISLLKKQAADVNKNEIDSESIVKNVMEKVSTLLDDKYDSLISEFNKQEELKKQEASDLLDEINNLKESFNSLKESNSTLQKNQKDGVDSIRRDLRILGGMVKKKSSESYQNIFGDEVESSLEIEENEQLFDFDNDSHTQIENDIIENNDYLKTIFEEPISSIEDEFDAELYEISKMEIADIFEKIDNLLENVDSDVLNINENNELKRHLHTFKGSVRMAGANKMGAIAHKLESLLDYSENHEISLYKIKFLLNKEIEKLHFLNGNTAVLSTEKKNWLDNIKNKNEINLFNIDNENELLNNIAPQIEKESIVSIKKEEKQYIRVSSNVLDSLINEAGEVRLSRTTLEGTLNSNRKSLTDLKISSHKLSRILKEIEVQAEGQMIARKDELEIGKIFDPLEFDRFTRLQELTRFMNEAVADVQDTVGIMDVMYRTQENAIVQQSIVTNNILDSLMKVRLISIDTISERLYQITRRAAKELNKHVSLEIFGEKTEIDRLVLDRIQPALEHLLRNCIAHGIESPNVREENNKSTIGKIKIDVKQDANFIILKVEDDGAGINLEKVKNIGYQKGLLSKDIEYTKEDIIDLIFKSGFSTADEISQLSGRGVGMDVVKNEIYALGGSIKTTTIEGIGTQFNIVLPVAVATNQAMLTEINGKLIAVPAILVEQIISLKKAKLEVAYEDYKVIYNEQEYPIYYLGHLMGLLSPNQNPEIKSYNTIILISYLNQNIAIHVDQLETTDEILIKPMGAFFGKISGLLGATLLGDGRQGVVVNPVLLKEHFNKNIQVKKDIVESHEVIIKKKETLTVMVVDDSITVRRATTKVLEKYGYNVILAKDGEDGLEKLQISIPDIILSDIEMPVMDGFEFVKNVKNTDKYKQIPIIMITSRTADKHKNLAYSLGVNEFLGKPYQEDELISQIKKLTNIH